MSLNPAMMHAPLFYRGLQRMRTSLLTRWNSYDRQADLSTASKEDLHFWISKIRSFQGREIMPPASQVITSDASTRGWGATCSDSQTGGPWTLIEAQDHINVLEFRAAFLALKTFASNLSNQHILLLIDMHAKNFLIPVFPTLSSSSFVTNSHFIKNILKYDHTSVPEHQLAVSSPFRSSLVL